MRSRAFRPLGFAHLCRSRPRGSIHSLLPSSLYLDHSHCPVLVPATLAALPSTRAIPDRDVFYVAHPTRSIETRSLPTLARCFPRSFTFYVAHPIRSIREKTRAARLMCVLLFREVLRGERL